MADRRIEHAIQKEKDRILNVLRAIPAPIHPIGQATVSRMYAMAETRARITVMAREGLEEKKHDE